MTTDSAAERGSVSEPLSDNATLAERIDRALDSDPVKLRDALYAVLDRLDAEVAGAKRQMAMGDYRLCPPDMLRIYCHVALDDALGEPR